MVLRTLALDHLPSRRIRIFGEKNDVVEIHDGMLDNVCYAKNDVSIGL